MSAWIIHDDRFAIELSHNKQALPFHNNAELNGHRWEVLDIGQEMGRISGPKNKVFVLPASTRPIDINFRLLSEFDFFSGDTVRIELRVVTATGRLPGKRVIIKRYQAQNFSWRVSPTEASQGAMLISVIRGNKHAPRSRFIPLRGAGGKPYTMEIGWRVSDTGMPGANLRDQINAVAHTSKGKERVPTTTGAARASSAPRLAHEDADAAPTATKRSADDASSSNCLQLALRKAQAKLDAAAATLDQFTNTDEEDAVKGLELLLQKVRAYEGVIEAEIQVKAAQVGDGEDGA